MGRASLSSGAARGADGLGLTMFSATGEGTDRHLESGCHFINVKYFFFAKWGLFTLRYFFILVSSDMTTIQPF